MNSPSGAGSGDAIPAAAPPVGPAVSRPVAGSAPADGAAGPMPPFVPSRDARPASPAAVAPAVGGEGEMAAALGEVAAQLERLAAGLRRSSLGELLARAESEDAEPLEVLITGYALGYAEALRQSG